MGMPKLFRACFAPPPVDEGKSGDSSVANPVTESKTPVMSPVPSKAEVEGSDKPVPMPASGLPVTATALPEESTPQPAEKPSEPQLPVVNAPAGEASSDAPPVTEAPGADPTPAEADTDQQVDDLVAVLTPQRHSASQQADSPVRTDSARDMSMTPSVSSAAATTALEATPPVAPTPQLLPALDTPLSVPPPAAASPAPSPGKPAEEAAAEEAAPEPKAGAEAAAAKACAVEEPAEAPPTAEKGAALKEGKGSSTTMKLLKATTATAVLSASLIAGVHYGAPSVAPRVYSSLEPMLQEYGPWIKDIASSVNTIVMASTGAS